MTNPPGPGETPSGWSAPGGQWGTPETGGYPGSTPPPPPPAGGHPGGNGIHTQPGIIPLHPLTLGQIFDGALKAIRTNPMVMFVFAAVVVSITTVIELVLTSSMFTDLYAFLDLLESDPEFAVEMEAGDLLGLMGGFTVPLLIGSLMTFIGSTILSGVLTLAVSQAVLGYKPTLGQVWDQAKGQLLRLLGLVLLITIVTIAVPAVLIGLTVLAALGEQLGLAVTIGVLSVLATIVWALFITAATALATPALMLERSGVLTGLRRGWALTRPFFWRVLGTYLLVNLIAMVVAYVIAMPAGIGALFLPPLGSLVLQGIAAAIASTLITPFTAGVMALLYIDIRIRREGLATELAAAAQ